MDYEITILTLTAPAPVGSSSLADRNIPFAGSSQSQPLDLTGATTQTMHVSDDDATLDGIYGARSYGGGADTDQVLSQDITLGSGSDSQVLLAGQQVGYDFSGRIFAMENGQITAVYEIAFPRIPGGTLGSIVGGKYSIMVIPISYTAKTGEVLDPVPFDPAKTYHYGGNVGYSSDHYQIDYFDVDCFATGTLIDTPDGPRAVETLRAGDPVVTRDAGAQPLVWTGHSPVDAARLDLQPNLRPIRIGAGALAPGCPARPLVLSPQHRVLVRSAIAARMFDRREVLVAAKHLVGLPGISVLRPARGVGYHHLLFQAHHLIRAEGAWTESLYLGPQAMKGLGPAGRREVMALFPELADAGKPPEPARRLLTGREGRKLAERHGRNRKPLSASDVADPARTCPLPV